MAKPQLLILLFSLTSILVICKSGSSYNLSLPGCPQTCGNMTVPYPFGIQEGCYLNEKNEFFISCNTTTDDAFLSTTNINVTDINLSSGELRAWTFVAHQCFDKHNHLSEKESNQYPTFDTGSWFTLSDSKNKFTVVGCDTYAFFEGNEGADYSTGCMSTCDGLEGVSNGTCAGSGCCQVAVPKGAIDVNITLSSFHNHSYVRNFDSCSYAFVVEESYYTFNSLDFTNLSSVVKQPLILDWTIGDQTCDEAKKNTSNYACKANSVCHDSNSGPGYICKCSPGFEGNPYLPTGCQDVDECITLNQPCNVTCINLPGSYGCSPCLNGYVGDGRKDGTGCVPVPSSGKKILIIALGISISLSTLLLAGAWMYWGLQKKKLIQLRKKHFKENGGRTLQEVLSHHHREIDAFKIYTADDLNKATHNYNESMILGQGGQGTVYKGNLSCNTIVAIKKSNAIDKSQVEQFINEIVVLSGINHKNVVKLLGCCLETEVPMLVYEFIAHGNLFDHIHLNHAIKIPWCTRLRIAAETAGAISYLHSAASIPIIHRDIKTSNILLDATYTAKVSDFGTSKFAPVDRTSLTTLVQGTMGYLDPEYFFSGQLTEKSDVYSFGVVLVELLTGAKAVNFERKGEERSLAMYFMISLKEERLFEIIDDDLKRQANGKQVMDVAAIVAKCLNVRGEDRPSMKEVATELEGLAKMEMMHPWVQVAGINVEEESESLIHASMRREANSLQIDGR